MKTDGRTEKLGHQGADVKFSAIKRVVIAFIIVLSLIHLGIWWLYQHVRTEAQRLDVRRTLVETKLPVPPEPRLQVSPQEDFQEYVRMQQEMLKTYGWVSRPEGKVRIPIDRAMELVVEREKRQ